MRAGSLINVNFSYRTSRFGHCVIFILKNSSFSVPYLPPIKVQPNENPVNIKSIINIYNPHTLKIPSITRMWMISWEQPPRPGVICMPTQSLSVPSPRFVFESTRLLVLSSD